MDKDYFPTPHALRPLAATTNVQSFCIKHS